MMSCPVCGKNSEVIDTRNNDGGIYRRRKCVGKEHHKISTMEVIIPQEFTGRRGNYPMLERLAARAVPKVLRQLAEDIETGLIAIQEHRKYKKKTT